MDSVDKQPNHPSTKPTPVHPGHVLRRGFLEPQRIPALEFSRRIGVAFHTLNELLHGRGQITSDLDVKLSAELGTPPGYWLGLQKAYQQDLLWKRTAPGRARSRIALAMAWGGGALMLSPGLWILYGALTEKSLTDAVKNSWLFWKLLLFAGLPFWALSWVLAPRPYGKGMLRTYMLTLLFIGQCLFFGAMFFFVVVGATFSGY